MQNDTGIIVIGTLFILAFGLVSDIVIRNQATATVETAQGSWACTTDVQVCPDGSTVGRIPPYCHFAPCAAR